MSNSRSVRWPLGQRWRGLLYSTTLVGEGPESRVPESRETADVRTQRTSTRHIAQDYNSPCPDKTASGSVAPAEPKNEQFHFFPAACMLNASFYLHPYRASSVVLVTFSSDCILPRCTSLVAGQLLVREFHETEFILHATPNNTRTRISD